MRTVYKILHWKDEIICNHGGTLSLDPDVLERDTEIEVDKRVVTDEDLLKYVKITGCSQNCTKVVAINQGKAKRLVVRGDAVPVLGNLLAISDKGCRVIWRDSLVNALAEDEGRQKSAYKDTVGKLTIGIGHNVDAHPVAGVTKTGDTIDENQIDQLFVGDSARAESRAQSDLNAPDPSVQNPLRFEDLTQGQQDALVNLTFNMGSLSGWPSFLSAMRRGDFAEAKKQLSVGSDGKSPSKWVQQVQSSRSSRILRLLSGADAHEAYAVPE